MQAADRADPAVSAGRARAGSPTGAQRVRRPAIRARRPELVYRAGSTMFTVETRAGRHAPHALALVALLGACGAGQDRAEPPSGAVDPRLITPATLGDTPHPAAGPPAGAGKIVMTREHCETLGRKFTELTLQQGGALGALGAGSAGDQEAAGVGRTFSEGCVRDLVGQTVDAREYECMLQAKSSDALLGCRAR